MFYLYKRSVYLASLLDLNGSKLKDNITFTTLKEGSVTLSDVMISPQLSMYVYNNFYKQGIDF